jgi:hypothetical protein
MANAEQLAILKDKGVTRWNNWRKKQNCGGDFSSGGI